MRSLCGLSACLALMVAISTSARADLVVNGGFEAETANGIGGYTPDSWSLTGNAANYYTGGETSGTGGILAHSGDWFASFSNFKPGSSSSPSGVSGLQQVISDTGGEQYTLTFWYTANGPGDTEITAKWNGDTLMDLTGPIGSLNGVWQSASFVVTGTGSDTLAFSGYMDRGWTGVDDVSLAPSAVPEPASFIMLGSGVAGLLAYARRRRASRPADAA